MKLHVEVHCELNTLLRDAERSYKSKDFDRAQELYRKAKRLSRLRSDDGAVPTQALIAFRLGHLMQQCGALDAAAEHYRDAVSDRRIADAKPDLAFAAYNNLATVQRKQGQLGRAKVNYEHAIVLRPDARVFVNLAMVLRRMGHREEALTAVERALRLEPDLFEAKLFACIAEIAVVYQSLGELERSRQRYARKLASLADDVAKMSLEERARAAQHVGLIQPFYLPYQGGDDRELQRIYGTMIVSLMAARLPRHAGPVVQRGRRDRERIRLGVVSRFLVSRQAVWKVPTSGWLKHLDRSRFEVIGYLTAPDRTVAEVDAAEWFDALRQGAHGVEAWADRIAADEVDALLFPEIGMDPLSLPLAALRLAPLQMATWGQPETTGMTTIDGFVSSDLMEPDDGAAHYTERLVRLPNLSLSLAPEQHLTKAVRRADVGLQAEDVIYWCSQSLYKCHPRYDGVFPRIAAKLPSAKFLFSAKQDDATAKIFEERLDEAFRGYGLRASDHCVYRHGVTKAEYLGLCELADVYLDTIGWSGCNTTLDQLAFDTPMVTARGTHMRGRHTSAILTMMGLEETIAEDEDGFVAIALRLGSDRQHRDRIARRIAASKKNIYNDPTPVRALERFVEDFLTSLSHNDQQSHIL